MELNDSHNTASITGTESAKETIYFDNITLLITHYNRSKSLERLLHTFDNLKCKFEEIIVSDDASNQTHLNRLEDMSREYSFKLVKAKTNKGLANNINKGDDEIKTDYTLYIQEDFIPKALFPEKLQLALEFMKNRGEIDMVRFYAYFNYPDLLPFKGGFSDMIFRKISTGYKKFYYYSDHPHLRRSTFLSKFGRYVEGIKSDRAEYKMMFSFLKASGHALFYDDYKSLFDQVNDSVETSTVKRNFLRENHNPLMVIVRDAYRLIRFNFDYFL